ncbi:hypothetical protein D3C71_1535250 [compost metagenome]
MLTPEDIAAFHRDGFVCVENILDEGEIARLRQACDSPEISEALAARRAQERLVHLMSALLSDPRVCPLMTAAAGVTFHHSLALHCSGPNRSGHRGGRSTPSRPAAESTYGRSRAESRPGRAQGLGEGQGGAPDRRQPGRQGAAPAVAP